MGDEKEKLRTMLRVSEGASGAMRSFREHQRRMRFNGKGSEKKTNSGLETRS